VFEKLKVTVSNGAEDALYEGDQIVMVLLNWEDGKSVNTQLVSNSDKVSTYAHAMQACATHLEKGESTFSTLMGKVVNNALESVMSAATSAAKAETEEE
jgi:hypothetical protein